MFMNQQKLFKRSYIYIYAGIFFILFIFNYLTPYLVDDFTYRLSFATFKPLQNLWEIFPSMAAHTKSMNGRTTAHFLVQLFMLMPPLVFDIVNSFFFCIQIALILSFSSEAKRNSLLISTVFCSIFFFEPVFGQVNLWQDGSVNYLWSIVFILIYLQPFAFQFLHGTTKYTCISHRIFFFVFSFFAGNYSETASAAAIFISVLLIILDALYRHKIDKFGLLCIVAAFIGYTCIYLSPAQWNNKSAELSLRILLYNFKDATSVYSSFGILACIALILLILNHYQKTDIKTILLGFVFILGSLAANYIMVFASYYHERSAVAAFTLLLTAIMILLTPLLGNLTWKPLIVCASSVLILSCFPVMLSAGLDIVYSYLHVMENRRCITECKENGIYDVVLPLVYPSTEYSAFYDMKYLDIEDVHSWPNESMAQYYGVDSILGTE